jgi:hypothetical protein
LAGCCRKHNRDFPVLSYRPRFESIEKKFSALGADIKRIKYEDYKIRTPGLKKFLALRQRKTHLPLNFLSSVAQIVNHVKIYGDKAYWNHTEIWRLYTDSATMEVSSIERTGPCLQ